jgi:hypothetical protein
LIKVLDPNDVLSVIKNEVFLNPPNLTLIYIKEQYKQDAKLSELLDENKFKLVHGSESDFYELINKCEDETIDRIFFIFTIDEFESLENLLILINNKIRKGGQVIISHVIENISRYAAKHFIDRNNIEVISIKLIEKRYKKYLSKMAFFLHFNIEAPGVLKERYNFYLYLLAMNKYKIKKFVDTKFILQLFYDNDFNIMKDDRDLSLIKLQKNY